MRDTFIREYLACRANGYVVVGCWWVFGGCLVGGGGLLVDVWWVFGGWWWVVGGFLVGGGGWWWMFGGWWWVVGGCLVGGGGCLVDVWEVGGLLVCVQCVF